MRKVGRAQSLRYTGQRVIKYPGSVGRDAGKFLRPECFQRRVQIRGLNDKCEPAVTYFGTSWCYPIQPDRAYRPN